MRLKKGTVKGADVKSINVKSNGITEIVMHNGLPSVRLSPAVSERLATALYDLLPGAKNAVVVFNEKLKKYGVIQSVGNTKALCFVSDDNSQGTYKLHVWEVADLRDVEGNWTKVP